MMIATLLAFLAVTAPQDKDPDKVRVTIDLQDASLKEVLDMVENLSGIPVEVDAAARKALDFDNCKISIKVRDLSVTGALRLMVGPRGCDATWVDKKKMVISPKAG